MLIIIQENLMNIYPEVLIGARQAGNAMLALEAQEGLAWKQERRSVLIDREGFLINIVILTKNRQQWKRFNAQMVVLQEICYDEKNKYFVYANFDIFIRLKM